MTTSNVTTTEQTDAMRAAAQEQQNEIDAGIGVEDAADSDRGQQQDEPTGRVVPEPGERGKPIQRSPQDDVRSQIANRFKRGGEEVPFNGDLSDPEMIYGEAGRAPALEPDVDPTIVGDPMPAPQKRVLKIRGQDVEMTEDQILAAAQKVTAADSYLQEAKDLLAEAKSIKAGRTGRDHQHPDGQSSAQDDGQDIDQPDDRVRHNVPGLKDVIEKIQFGDPEEAAEQLGKFIKDAAKNEANEGHIERLFNNDLAKSQKALKDFTDANPDLAKDKKAALAIEAEMYDLYKEDIVKLGIDEAQIPTDPKTLANWHRFYKINGHAVRNTPDLLAKAKENFEAWRGTSKSTPQPAPRKEAPRVQVNVDRTERRLAIPTQPTRAVAPRRDTQAAPQKTPGSDVVAEMRRARGQI